ncbi:hypothetical protein D3C78_988390 [compost metagenome]
MIEELAKEHEPGVEPGRQPLVRRRVGEEQRLAGGNRIAVEIEQHPVVIQRTQARLDVGLHGRRIGDGLIDDQVGDDPRLGIGHELLIGVVGREVLLLAEEHEPLVRGPVGAVALGQVIEGAIDRAQSPGYLRVRQQFAEALPGGMGFRNQYLLKDEFEI